VEVEMAGQLCRVERIGTDGILNTMIEMISSLDGKVDAFGLGGMDLYIFAGNRRYVLREAKKVVRAARKTPIVDGSGLKNTLERIVVGYLLQHTDILDSRPHVLMMAGSDRFGMAEALEEAGCPVTCGDLVFTIGVPVPLRSLKALDLVARVLAPVICQLPLSMLYPTGKKQEENKPKAPGLFAEAGVVAGDFHFIKRYMPADMSGKVIITNTTTAEDVALLRERGVKTLVTTTPELQGRSFGTNVMEALLVALAGEKRELTAENYTRLLRELNFRPRITNLQ
jgi:hypothetical protein